jgi:hypothetical protein
LGLVAVLFSTAPAGMAVADDEKFDLQVTVASISDAEGSIDPKGRHLDDKLSKKFRYNSLKVIESRRMGLKMDELGSIDLPDGNVFRVRPMNLGDRGLLLSVEWEGAVMMDMRAQSEHLVVIGGPQFRDGQLVVGIEPHY